MSDKPLISFADLERHIGKIDSETVINLSLHTGDPMSDNLANPDHMTNPEYLRYVAALEDHDKRKSVGTRLRRIANNIEADDAVSAADDADDAEGEAWHVKAERAIEAHGALLARIVDLEAQLDEIRTRESERDAQR